MEKTGKGMNCRKKLERKRTRKELGTNLWKQLNTGKELGRKCEVNGNIFMVKTWNGIIGN